MDIVSCDSTTFKRGKRSLSPFEAELAGELWALSKEHYFTCGAPRIVVYCDAEGLGGFWKQDMEKIGNTRAQAMVEELQVYPIEVVHVPGAKVREHISWADKAKESADNTEQADQVTLAL